MGKRGNSCPVVGTLMTTLQALVKFYLVFKEIYSTCQKVDMLMFSVIGRRERRC